MFKFYAFLSSFLLIFVWSCKNQAINSLEVEDSDEEISSVEGEDIFYGDVESIAVIIDLAIISFKNEDIEGAYSFLIQASQKLKQDFIIESNEDSLLMIKAITQLQLIAIEVKEKKISNIRELEQALSQIEYLYGSEDEEFEMEEEESNEDEE